MADDIPFARPSLGDAEADAVVRTLRSGWITQGPQVAAFEDAFAAFTGAGYARAVSSGTAAIHLALIAVGVKAGDVVLTTSHSFIATANAIRMAGAEPVFVDIDAEGPNMDTGALSTCLAEEFEERDGGYWYGDVERLAQGESPLAFCAPPFGRLAAVLAVHQVGMPADMNAIMAMAGQYGAPVVEDAACASGSEIDIGDGWQPIGRPIGKAACFSFHPRKVLTTGDGGMLTTDAAEFHERFRLLRQHGMSVSDTDRHNADEIIRETYDVSGFNYRMTDVQASIGLVQLQKLKDAVAKRRALAARYGELLQGIGGVAVPTEPPFARGNWQSYVIRLEDEDRVGDAVRALKAKGIDTRFGITTIPLEAPYRSLWPEGAFPNSERASRDGLILPLFSEMTEDQVQRVAEALASVLQ